MHHKSLMTVSCFKISLALALHHVSTGCFVFQHYKRHCDPHKLPLPPQLLVLLDVAPCEYNLHIVLD